tara:strand:- start:436 stop:747 length:312 start_codon:yes stop_codon:yes gene_type:complete
MKMNIHEAAINFLEGGEVDEESYEYLWYTLPEKTKNFFKICVEYNIDIPDELMFKLMFDHVKCLVDIDISDDRKNQIGDIDKPVEWGIESNKSNVYKLNDKVE